MNYLRNLMARRRERAIVATLEGSVYFDTQWYAATYPDLEGAGLSPVLHYVRHGAMERRDPGPGFSTAYYLDAYPDVAEAQVNPLFHFITMGEREGRQPLIDRSPTPARLISVTPGSQFAELSLHDPASILRWMVRTATPADKLARPSDTLASPLISLIVPTYNTDPQQLHEVVQSIRAQTYDRWQLCLTDDGSSRAETLAVLDEISASGDPRVVVRKLEHNVGIAKASQESLLQASGEFVGFVDHDDLLTPNALSEVVQVIRDDPHVDYIYSDHAMIGSDSIPKAFSRKPSWSPEFLLATNYIVHFKVVRRERLIAAGGLAGEVNQAQDLGMSLRLVRHGARVRHVPKILYLWRDHPASVASSSAAKPGIEGKLIETYNRHLEATGSDARVIWPNIFQADRVGVFKPQFIRQPKRVTLFAYTQGVPLSAEALHESLLMDADGVELKTASLSVAQGGPSVIDWTSDEAILRSIGAATTPYVGFVNAKARHLGSDWLLELTGFVDLDEAIAAACGKSLDSYLTTVGAGMLLDQNDAYRTIGGGDSDNVEAHWFIGQIASNVDAVAVQPMVARKDALMKAGGLRLNAFGDLAGLPFSESVRRDGMRLVYNPAAKVLCPVQPVVPKGAERLSSRRDQVNRPRIYE